MNKLQSPGAGLPPTERVILNGILKAGSKVRSDASILKAFSKESDLLFQIADHDNAYDAFHPVLIPRVIGIEDASRKWSVMMILEHLCLTNLDMMKAIKALTNDVVPRGELAIELYKPDDQLGFDVLERYQDVNDRYARTIREVLDQHGKLPTRKTFAHPWFGRLNAHQWHFLAYAHQKIHRRQAKKIVAMLGIT